MQPLDDFNPDIYNYPPSATLLEFIGAMTIAFIIAITFQWIMSKK